MLYVQYPSWISPQILSFLPIRWYGLMYVAAFITGYMFILTQIKKEKDAKLENLLPNLFMWIFIGMILGARLVSELVYSRNVSILIQPWMLIWPFHEGRFTGIQGMSYHGGLIGIVISSYIFCKLHKVEFARFADKASIGAALGYTFGRLGNFTNGELYGRITDAPWGMLFHHAELLPIADPRVREVARAVKIEANKFGLVNLPRHPSQIYEALSEGIVVFLILYTIYTLIKTKVPQRYIPGTIAALYVICYGLARFVIEYFRQPDTGLDFIINLSNKSNPNWLLVSPFNFTTGQVLSSIMILGGIIIFFIIVILSRLRKRTLQVPTR